MLGGGTKQLGIKNNSWRVQRRLKCIIIDALCEWICEADCVLVVETGCGRRKKTKKKKIMKFQNAGSHKSDDKGLFYNPRSAMVGHSRCNFSLLFRQ